MSPSLPIVGGLAQRPTSQLSGGQERFRLLIAKVGSGEHTSTGLDRDEACEALDLMLSGEASDAQMGAFLIAHRIRRPAPMELTGMLDSYRRHGPKLKTQGRRALCFCVPYDGRSRTAPLIRNFRVSTAHTGFFSPRVIASQVSASASTDRSGSPDRPGSICSVPWSMT